MNQYLQKKEGEFRKALDFFKEDIGSLRTGRANPAMLEKAQVEAYGAKSPLNSLASITVADARGLLVSPWDKSILKEIEKGISAAQLGFAVVNEGDRLRLTLPLMIEEDRRNLVKQLNEKMEKARIALRQIRDEVKEAIEEGEKNKEIGEDDRFRFVKELDEEMVRLNEELKEIRDKKEKEIMSV